jgi:hypothetical protein
LDFKNGFSAHGRWRFQGDGAAIFAKFFLHQSTMPGKYTD